MKFSIITPTVQRNSLWKACMSVEQQTHQDWEHIVMVDSEFNAEMMFSLTHPKRTIRTCENPHRNGGNTCRHNAWKMATGDYVFYLDDDNYLADATALERIAGALEGDWGLFPIYRHGSIFYFDPPKPCYFDTGNAVVRRELAEWPDINDYASDAVWLEGLLKHPYQVFPRFAPIMVMPGTSFGAGGGINGH